jgi:hypothetical protein
MTLTQERLKQVLHYDPLTGEFTRLTDGGGKKAGDPAGCKKRTYIVISVDDKIYRAHLLAWLYMKGEWPKPFLDHKDLTKHNNIFENLREATKSQNSANRGVQKNSASGYKGVFWYRAYGKWTSQIWKDKKAYFLGYFDTAIEAHNAYSAKAQELYGEFARAA